MHGYILALGQSIAHSRSLLSQSNFESALETLIEHLDYRVQMIKGASCDAIAAIGVTGTMNIPNHKANILDKLIVLVNSKEQKVMEKAVISLGFVAYGEKDMEFSIQLLEGVFFLSDNTNEEVQLAVGEALAKAASSSILTEYIFNKIMKEYYISPKPATRRATAIWLLALVKFNGSNSLLQANISDIQAAFTSMLNDKSDLVQECAGRGLALLYETCKGDTIKKDLLHSLVNSLTAGVKTAGLSK
jgi:hypothetical protein